MITKKINYGGQVRSVNCVTHCSIASQFIRDTDRRTLLTMYRVIKNRYMYCYSSVSYSNRSRAETIAIKRNYTVLRVCHMTEITFLSSETTLWFKKNAPTLADYNNDPVQSILIIFSRLFVNDHKSCLVVKFSTSPRICCHYTL